MAAGTVEGTGIGAPDFVRDIREPLYVMSTDKDLHFTNSLVKNATEEENITGMRSNRTRVVQVSLQAIQQLIFELSFYRKDTFADSDLDDDSFLGSIRFDLTRYGITISGTSQYRMDVGGLDLDYLDDDLTKELHIVLANLHPTTKLAGSNGEVKIDIICEDKA